jgi:hypothetical protein
MSRASRRSRPTDARTRPATPPPTTPPRTAPATPPAAAHPPATGPSNDAEPPALAGGGRAIPEFDPTDRVDIPLDADPTDPTAPTTPTAPTATGGLSRDELDRLMEPLLAEVEQHRRRFDAPFFDDEDEDDDGYGGWLHDTYDAWLDDMDVDGYDDEDCLLCAAIERRAAAPATRLDPPIETTAIGSSTRTTTPTEADRQDLESGLTPSGRGDAPGTSPGDVTLPLGTKIPLTDDAALQLIRRSMSVPAEHQTMVLLLDERRCGGVAVVVSGTVDPDAVIEVVRHLAVTAAELGEVASMVVASVRPVGGAVDAGVGLDDVDRWFCIDEITDFQGIHLIEWYVLDGSGRVTRPRDLTFEPSRW